MLRHSVRQTGYRKLLALALPTLLVLSVSGAAAAFKNIKVGDQALPLSLEDLEGQVHSIADYRDAGAVLLFFWATWSDRSLKQMDDLVKLADAYGDKGLRILAVNVEKQEMGPEDRAAVKSTAAEKQVPFPVLVDEGLRVYNEWGVIATPTTALVDREGTVVFDLSSYPTSGYLDLEEAVKKTLGLVEEEAAEAVAAPAYQPKREALLHFGLGKRHAQLGFMSKAIPELEKAAAADSGWADPRIHLGFAFIREGEKETAVGHLDAASALDPGRPEPVLLRAWLLASEGKVDEALELLQGGAAGPEPLEAVGRAPEAGTSPEVAGPAAQEQAPGAVGPALEGLDEVRTLLEEGKGDEAAGRLTALLEGRLGEMGFTMKKKRKLGAMEKMRLMMQKKQEGAGAPEGKETP